MEVAATVTETKKEDGFFAKLGKGAARLLGDGAGYIGTMAAIAGVIAFVGVYVVPAFFGILGTAVEGGSWALLGSKLLEPLPYFAAWIGGSGTVALAGLGLAELAGGSRILKAGEEMEREEAERQARKAAKAAAKEIEKPSAGLDKTAAPSFNKSSPRVEDTQPNLALDIAVLSMVMPSLGGSR